MRAERTSDIYAPTIFASAVEAGSMNWSRRFQYRPIATIECDERGDHDELASGEIGCVGDRERRLAEDDALKHPQHVRGAEQHAERRDDGPIQRARSDCHAPRSDRNSPTKPDSPGRPSDANRREREQTPPMTGIWPARPESSAICRVCVRS